MSDEQVWNDGSREQLFETLRWFIRGEIRLAKRGRDDVLAACRAMYIRGDCPASECDAFVQFSADEFDRAAAGLESERAAWPDVTDCDRLDRVELALRERGILLWQVSPCCDTCTGGELRDRIDAIDRRDPGFRDRVRGFSFFIDQTMPEELSDATELSVFLGYGWISPNNADVAPEVYEKHALGIAREVCECLRDQGFEPNWNGKLDRKIGVSLNWQRRTLLE